MVQPEESEFDESEDPLLLPQPEDRESLVAEVSKLIGSQGFVPWINAHLLAPTETFFPDPWRGGEASVRRVARRLLHYAGMPDHDLDIEIYDEAPGRRGTPVGKPVLQGMAELQVWFQGERDGVFRFGVESVAMRTPHFFVASMARAVAWAWLSHKGVTVNESAEGQRRVDLATHYLGFGLLTTDSSVRHGAEATGGFSSKRSVTRLGLLSPRAMSFVLGIHSVTRGLSKKEMRAVEKHLQPNHVAFVRAGARWVHAHPEKLLPLGLPDPDTWPPPPSLAVFTQPFTDDDRVEEDRKDVDRGIAGMNEGQMVFRVERDMTARLVKASMLTVSFGAVSSRMSAAMSIDMVYIVIAAAVLMTASLIFGRFFRESRCSEPKCAAPLTADLEQCPLCLGRVMGVIDDPKKRLAAEEEFELSAFSGGSDTSGESNAGVDAS